MLKGLLFDLDGVITDTAIYHYQAWKEIANRIGITIDINFNEQLKGISREESLERILEHGSKENKFTTEEKRQLTHEKNEFYLQLIEQLTPQDILPGITEIIQDAKEEQLKLAIASASKNAPSILKKLGLFNDFDTIVDPGAIQNGKPYPDIFLAAAKQLELKISEVAGIEDSESGIEALNTANIFSVGVGSETSLGEADYLVPNTSELTLDNIQKHFK